jgi:hypothetical protein
VISFGQPVGARAVAYDPIVGNTWLVNGAGHVLRWGGTFFRRGYYDLGAPPGGATSIAVYNGAAFVIASSTTQPVGGPVFELQNGAWSQMGGVDNATAIAASRANGLPFIITANNAPDPTSDSNILVWMSLWERRPRKKYGTGSRRRSRHPVPEGP